MASAQEANAKTTDQYSQASRPSATEKEKGVQQQQTAGESKDAQNFNPFQVQEEAKEAAKEAFVAQQEAQEVIKRAYTKQLKAQDKARRAAEQLFAQQEGGKQAAALAARQAATTAVEEQKSDAQKQMEQAVITAQVLGAQIAEQTVASDQSSASARLNPRGNVPQPSSVPSFQQPGENMMIPDYLKEPYDAGASSTLNYGGIQSGAKRSMWTRGEKQGLFCFKTKKKMEWIKSRGDLLM